MDLTKPDFSLEGKDSRSSAVAVSCSICLDPVLDHGGRSIAKLQCGHEFHLDCIGSAFNAKGSMQCPNCRKVEKGRWLYANGHRSSTDIDIDSWVTEDMYDLGYSEVPYGFQWCPFRGFTQLASFFEEAESLPSSYQELVISSAFGEHSNTSNNSQVCPYLALHGFTHPVHAATSGSTDSVSENGPFHRHPSGLGGQSSAEMMGSHNFPSSELQNHNWLQHSVSFPLSGNADQSASQYSLRLPRHDASSQQRLGSFVHPQPLTTHGSVARNASNLVGQLGPPSLGELRGHARGLGNRMYQQSMPSSSLQTSQFTPIRRMRPRGFALVSSASVSSSAEIGGFYGFSVSGSVNRNLQEGDNVARPVDRYYGWGREVTPLPWIPVEGESQWWGPFNPNQNPPASFTQRAAAERVQNRPENGYQRVPLLPRMPPYM